MHNLLNPRKGPRSADRDAPTDPHENLSPVLGLADFLHRRARLLAPEPDCLSARERLGNLCTVLAAEGLPVTEMLSAMRYAIGDALQAGLTLIEVYTELHGAGLRTTFRRLGDYVEQHVSAQRLAGQAEHHPARPAAVAAVEALDGLHRLTGQPLDAVVVANLLFDEIAHMREIGCSTERIAHALHDCGIDVAAAELDVACHLVAALRHSGQPVKHWRLLLDAASTRLTGMVGLGCSITDIQTMLGQWGIAVPRADIEAWYRTVRRPLLRRAVAVDTFLTDYLQIGGHAIATSLSFTTQSRLPMRVIVLCAAADDTRRAWDLVNAIAEQMGANPPSAP